MTTTLEGPSNAARPGEHLVEHAAERVEVGAAVDGIARDLLGRHVLGRPEDGEAAQRALPVGRGPLARLSVERDGHAEVEQLDLGRLAVAGQHQVLRLEVAVHEARRVRRLERLRRLDRDAHRLAPRRVGRSASRASSVSPTQSSIARKARPSSDLPKS